MGLDWQDLLSALGLLMIVEGVAPFLFPEGWRRAMQRLALSPLNTIRTAGFAFMLAGLVLLNLVR